MAPWSVFLPAAMVHAHRHSAAKCTSSKSDRFVLTFFWTVFTFFSWSGSRRSYYILPILPAAAILIARIFVIGERELNDAARSLVKVGFWVVASVLIFSGVALLPVRVFLPMPYSLLPMLPHPGIFAVCWLLSLVPTAYACIRCSRERMLSSVGVTSYLLLLYLFVVAMPAGDKWRGEKQFAEATRQLIHDQPDRLAAFKATPPVFYLGFSKPVPQYDSTAELASALRNGQVGWIILRRRDIPALNIAAREAVAEATYPWDSPERRSNALVLLKLQLSAAL
jgi:4-amino-4-deoxy-L-arabinose transferase-like glycosyltransferase